MVTHAMSHQTFPIARLLGRMSAGAAFGGLAAALFGTAFALLGQLAGWDLSGVLPVAGYLALCGAASGSLVGMIGATIEGAEARSDGALSCRPAAVSPEAAPSDPAANAGSIRAERPCPASRARTHPDRRVESRFPIGKRGTTAEIR